MPDELEHNLILQCAMWSKLPSKYRFNEQGAYKKQQSTQKTSNQHPAHIPEVLILRLDQFVLLIVQVLPLFGSLTPDVVEGSVLLRHLLPLLDQIKLLNLSQISSRLRL